MKKTGVILITIMLLIVSVYSIKGAFDHNCTYKGENEFWTAEYKVYDTKILTDKRLIVSYKKNLSDLSSIKHLEISYESSIGGGKLTEDFGDNPPKERTYTLKGNGSGGMILNKDEVVKVNISIDGKTQTIELRNIQ